MPEPVQARSLQVAPTPARAELLPAPRPARLMAFAVDVGVVSTVLAGAMGVLAVVLAVVLAAAAGTAQGLRQLAEPMLPDWAMNLGLLGLILVTLFGVIACLALFDAYFIYYEYYHGTTPGKRLFGLAVATLDGGRPTLGQCVVREILRHVDCLLVLPGLLSVSFTRHHQRLGDLLASTWVIVDPAAEAGADPIYLSRDEYRRLRSVLGLAAPVADTLRHEFLAVAYPSLALGLGPMTADTRARWLVAAREHLAGQLPDPVDDDLALRLFAELCTAAPHQGRG